MTSLEKLDKFDYIKFAVTLIINFNQSRSHCVRIHKHLSTVHIQKASSTGQIHYGYIKIKATLFTLMTTIT